MVNERGIEKDRENYTKILSQVGIEHLVSHLCIFNKLSRERKLQNTWKKDLTSSFGNSSNSTSIQCCFAH